jgi:hypothetical protein
MMDQLELATLHRTGATNPLRRERHTLDFVVNGLSLFEAAPNVVTLLAEPSRYPSPGMNLSCNGLTLHTGMGTKPKRQLLILRYAHGSFLPNFAAW